MLAINRKGGYIFYTFVIFIIAFCDFFPPTLEMLIFFFFYTIIFFFTEEISSWFKYLGCEMYLLF